MPQVTASGLTLEQATAALATRRENKPEKVDNGSLYAGSPMYYYCRHCDGLAAKLAEDHRGPPPPLCQECKEMDDNGWLKT